MLQSWQNHRLIKKSQRLFDLALVIVVFGLFGVVFYILVLQWNEGIGSAGIHGGTALHYAIINNKPEKTRLLIDKGVNIEAPAGRNSSTPLVIAAARGYLKVAEILIQNGAKVDSRNTLDRTPLMVAVKYGEVDMVALLLENGADKKLTDKNGKSAHDIAREAYYSAIDPRFEEQPIIQYKCKKILDLLENNRKIE